MKIKPIFLISSTNSGYRRSNLRVRVVITHWKQKKNMKYQSSKNCLYRSDNVWWILASQTIRQSDNYFWLANYLAQNVKILTTFKILILFSSLKGWPFKLDCLYKTGFSTMLTVLIHNSPQIAPFSTGFEAIDAADSGESNDINFITSGLIYVKLWTF